ncbi:hypothetical protein GCM10010429_21110 [Micromonospora olivasterospora]
MRAAGKAARTQIFHGQSIRSFCDWLTAQGRPTTLGQLNRHSISVWLADLSHRGRIGMCGRKARPWHPCFGEVLGGPIVRT